MCIEFTSLIIGMILWELIRNYLVKVIIPEVLRIRTNNNRQRAEKLAYKRETKENKETK